MSDVQKQSKSKFWGCLKIALIIAVIGYVVESFGSSSCDICGDYSYQHFESESTFSDSDIADIVGKNRVEEYKRKLSSEPAMNYAITIDRPEQLESGGTRADIIIGIQTRYSGDVIYKGQVVTTTGEDVADGIIRIEHRYNDFLSKYEQITFGNDRNILLYKLDNQGLIIWNSNSSEFGLSTLDHDLFTKD